VGLRKFKLFRGDSERGTMEDYKVEVDQGMVVLDVIHRIQAKQAGDLAVRWNCKAGKCGSCSVEINGKPKLSCMTRMNEYESDETIAVRPIKTFPLIKDLVADVSWNYKQNKMIPPFNLGEKQKGKNLKIFQQDVERIQEFRKCIECYLCQDVCHVLRDHAQNEQFVGPRFMIRLASLEMHPLDNEDRISQIKHNFGSGMCNITRCCTDVCPEHIQITDNGIIPLKERVVDRFYDPFMWLYNKIFSNRTSRTNN
jgi:succinate dehydrogenase / fumarate reductase iron-sulfur subunit